VDAVLGDLVARPRCLDLEVEQVGDARPGQKRVRTKPMGRSTPIRVFTSDVARAHREVT
jgi:hypothetical protein